MSDMCCENLKIEKAEPKKFIEIHQKRKIGEKNISVPMIINVDDISLVSADCWICIRGYHEIIRFSDKYQYVVKQMKEAREEKKAVRAETNLKKEEEKRKLYFCMKGCFAEKDIPIIKNRASGDSFAVIKRTGNHCACLRAVFNGLFKSAGEWELSGKIIDINAEDVDW